MGSIDNRDVPKSGRWRGRKPSNVEARLSDEEKDRPEAGNAKPTHAQTGYEAKTVDADAIIDDRIQSKDLLTTIGSSTA